MGRLRDHRGHGPEYNLIQRPELLQRARKMLGTRQAHFLPALNEGLQAVVVVDDFRQREEGIQQVRRCYGGIELLGDGANIFSAGLYNTGPTASPAVRKLVRLYRVILSYDQGAAAGNIPIHVAYSVDPAASTLGIPFDRFGTRRFAHVQADTEYTTTTAPRAQGAARPILAPFVPIGVVHYLINSAQSPYIIDLPGLILTDDAFFDLDISGQGGTAITTNHHVYLGFEWTEENVGA